MQLAKVAVGKAAKDAKVGQTAIQVFTNLITRMPPITVNNTTVSTNPQTAGVLTNPTPPTPTPTAYWYYFGGIASAVTVFGIWKWRHELRRLLGVGAITHVGHGKSGVIVLESSGQIDEGKLQQAARKLSEWSSLLNGVEVEVILEVVDVPAIELINARFIPFQVIESKSYDELYEAQLDSLVLCGTLPGAEVGFWTWVEKNNIAWLLLRILIGRTLKHLLDVLPPTNALDKHVQYIKVLSETEKKHTTSSQGGDFWQFILTSVGIVLHGDSLYNLNTLQSAVQGLHLTEATKPAQFEATVASLEGSGKRSEKRAKQ